MAHNYVHDLARKQFGNFTTVLGAVRHHENKRSCCRRHSCGLEHRVECRRVAHCRVWNVFNKREPSSCRCGTPRERKSRVALTSNHKLLQPDSALSTYVRARVCVYVRLTAVARVDGQAGNRRRLMYT